MLTHRIVAYLIGLAVGYWVLTLADKQMGFTKTIGKIIAWIIMVVSICGPLCIAGCGLFCCHRADGGWCSMGGRMNPPGMTENQGMPCDKGMMGDKGKMGDKEKMEKKPATTK